MTPGDALPTAPVQIAALSLLSVEFQREESIPDDATNVSGNFNLAAGDPENDKLRADFLGNLVCEGAWSVKVHYVIVLEKVDPFPEEMDEEAYWELAAQRTAPVIMYPYVRETITSLLAKAGLPPVMPPVLNFSEAVEVDEDSTDEEA